MCCLTCCLSMSMARAGQHETGDHIIFFTSIDSRLVPPLVARAHGLPRGPRYLTISISVQEKDTRTTVSAQVTGHATNLLAQTTDLAFREVREQDALYYLASHNADQQDTHHYHLVIQPAGATAEPIRLNFDYRYFSGGEITSRGTEITLTP